MKGGEEVSGAHPTVLVDLNEQLDGVPVYALVVVLYEFYSHDLFEENVDLSASVPSKVEILYHPHQVFVANLVNIPSYLRDQSLTYLLLD